MKSHTSSLRCSGRKKKNDMAAEPSTLRKGGNGREAEVLRRAVEIQLVSQETTSSHQKRGETKLSGSKMEFFLLAAAGVDPGRRVLQSAEQKCQRRYSRIYRLVVRQFLTETCKKRQQAEHNGTAKAL